MAKRMAGWSSTRSIFKLCLSSLIVEPYLDRGSPVGVGDHIEFPTRFLRPASHQRESHTGCLLVRIEAASVVAYFYEEYGAYIVGFDLYLRGSRMAGRVPERLARYPVGGGEPFGREPFEGCLQVLFDLYVEAAPDISNELVQEGLNVERGGSTADL